MARQEANEAFAQTSFLYGGNAAYIDELYAQYQENPSSVNAEWRSFFTALKEEDADIAKNASGASWKKENWPRVQKMANWSQLLMEIGRLIRWEVNRS